MNLSFRARRRLRRLGIALLCLLLISIVIWLCWVVWLERYVVYSREGATLNFDVSSEDLTGEIAVPPAADSTVGIYINEGSNTINLSKDLTPIYGYYADTEALKGGVDAVRSQIMAIPPDMPLMLDVKGINGAFHYSSIVGTSRTSGIDTGAMDKLIKDMSVSEHYLIARLPGLRDWEFGLNNVDCGLFLPSGIGLWMDDDGCYWLDPTATGTMTYLIRIVNELRDLGFDEVVFSDFRFPASDNAVFNGDKMAALSEAAALLVSSCATDSFAVSFASSSTEFPLPQGRSRLYLQDIEAADVLSAVADTGIENPEIYVVLVSKSNDTRYDAYSVMRPVSIYH